MTESLLKIEGIDFVNDTIYLVIEDLPFLLQAMVIGECLVNSRTYVGVPAHL